MESSSPTSTDSSLSAALAQVLAGYDPAGARIELINRSENDTYRVELATGGRPAILRVYRPDCRSEAEITSELDWMASLRDDAGISTPRVLRTLSGRRISWLLRNHSTAIPCVLFEHLEGEEPPSSELPRVFACLGSLAARIHLHSRGWSKPPGFLRHRLNGHTLIGPDAVWGDWRLAPHLTGADISLLSEVGHRARLEVAVARGAEASDCLIHGDLRVGNILQDGKDIHVIDFDDCAFSWPLFELATSLSLLEHTPQAAELIDCWLEGYVATRNLKGEERDLVPHFIMIRRLQILSWFASHPATQIATQYAPVVVPSTIEAGAAYLSKPRCALGASA